MYRRELSTYFRSAAGYMIAAMMLLICGILFQTQALGHHGKLSADVLSAFFRFCSGCTIGAGLALSIRLFTEERSQHTMVLLKTSPVHNRSIVTAKFLAALTFLSLILFSSLYMPLLIQVHGKISSGQIVVGYLGLFLLGASVLSIGLFASAFSENYLVASALALVIVVCMSQLYPLGLKLEGPMARVLMSLDLWHEHFGLGFMRGIVNLKDIFYYLAIVYFFLLLSVRTLEAKRWQ